MGEFHKTGAFRWLHLTDLHLGMPGQASLWPNVEEIFLNDLKFLRDNVGPWDMVLFTGDLTQRGTKPEFDELDKLLQTLWSRFKEWGFTPELLAIPGNHDLVRPENQVDPSLITLLKTWNVPEVQEPFWDDKRDSSQRALISAAFQNYAHWWKHTSIPKPATINRGFLPGDCSTSYTADDLNLGIVGLNSAYLQLGAGNFEKKLHLDVRQFHAACNGNGTVWTKQHDVCLLLTHHPEVWLNPEAQKQFLDEIYSPPERFALHQFGHMHDGNLSAVSHGGGSERRRLQGCSLFALESWGEEKKEKRNHGYSLCELKRENNELKLRIWPRRANEITGGGRTIDRDLSFDLEKHDGGTNPIVVKRLEPKHVVISDRTGAEAAPIDAPVSYDPRNPPFFVHYRQKGDQVIGRETALAKVRQQLTTGRPTAIGQTAVFQGLGGLGKTQLAVEYAHNYRDAYPNGVIWLTADQDLDAQLVDLAVEARWVAPASEHRHKLEVALHRLRSYSDCLIIFDNLEQLEVIKGYLPEPPAEPHILVTSRTEQPDFAYVPIDLLDSGQSLRMLTQEAGHQPEKASDWEAARKIAETLGGLPLALELAGAYLFRRPVSWQEYLKLLQYNLKIALPSRLSSLTGHEADLYSTLQISESVLTEEPQLQGILDVLTWSGPAPMGLDLLATLVGVEDHAELTNALSLGTALRILQHTPDTDSYALHRLVREVRREQNPLAERPTWAADLCQRTGDWFDAHRRDFAQLPRFESEIDHLREWHDHSLKFAPQQASRLTWLQAYPPFHRGQPREIKRLVEISHSEYDQHGCNDRPLLAHLNNDLAFSICELGDPKGALELAEQVLAVRRELFGERHPDTADSLNNVASCYSRLGDPKRALKLTEQALAIRRELFGERHPDTADSLNNVAICCGKLGDPKRALALAEQALAVRRGLFGERHPNTADSLNNVAGCQSELGNPKGALELSEQALAIRRELFGERHPNTADSLNNVAIYCSKLGDPKGALELAEQALAILRELFGERHPSTTNALSNVAMCHSALGNPKRALELSEQALAIQNELFGERHPSTATILYNMADYLRRLGNTSIAYAYAQKALEIETSIFGSQHSTTLKTAKLLSRIGRPGFRVPSLKKTTNKNKKGKARR